MDGSVGGRTGGQVYHHGHVPLRALLSGLLHQLPCWGLSPVLSGAPPKLHIHLPKVEGGLLPKRCQQDASLPRVTQLGSQALNHKPELNARVTGPISCLCTLWTGNVAPSPQAGVVQGSLTLGRAGRRKQLLKGTYTKCSRHNPP